MSDELQKRINDLERLIGKSSSSSASCFPSSITVGACLPFVIALFLFLIKPPFVKRKEGDISVFDAKKFFFSTLAITILGWIGLYIYGVYSKNKSLTCLVS